MCCWNNLPGFDVNVAGADMIALAGTVVGAGTAGSAVDGPTGGEFSEPANGLFLAVKNKIISYKKS